MTLDKLASMVARGFAKTVTKEELGSLKNEICDLGSEMNTQFNELEGKLEAYTSFWHRKFSEHEAWLQNLDKSVANLERHIGKK